VAAITTIATATGMSDPLRPLGPLTEAPPPPPPLPPPRGLQRFIAPFKASRNVTDPVLNPDRAGPDPGSGPPPGLGGPQTSYSSSTKQRSNAHTLRHRTGIGISAIDINRNKTHAILAGKDILKTVRIDQGKATEDLNLRSSIVSYASTHGSPKGDTATRRRDYLPARDVKWSNGQLLPHLVATAAANGRISLYDVNAAGSRIELAWLHQHTGQINKIDIDPFAGRYLLSASQDRTVRLWDLRDPKAAKSKYRFDVRAGVRHVAWSPKEGNDFDFAVCADGGLIQNWDARNTLGPKLSIHAHDTGCYSLDWHPDGRHVVSGGFDKYVRVWDFKTDLRRQKPAYSFRVPQAVRSVSWRPPHDDDGAGVWHTTQLATTYHESDPRIHVWDLKRPTLSFVELDDLVRPANDFLWAAPDLMWTAGDDGVFSQYDISSLPLTENTLSPSAALWLPGGENALFMQERPSQYDVHFDTSAFLAVPGDRLSGGDGVHRSRDYEDEEHDGGSQRHSLSISSRRQTRELSFRSDTSQANSPPDKRVVQPLSETVSAKRVSPTEGQIGAIGTVPSAPEDRTVASFLSASYAPVATDAERRNSPDNILGRLEEAFMQNAGVCDELGLYRLGQSWRMLSIIVIPELRDWAEGNREARKREAAERQLRRRSNKTTSNNADSPSFAKLPARERLSRIESRDNKLMSTLFRGVKDSSARSEHGGSSSMTTPLAKPVPDSPSKSHRHQRSKGSSSTLGIVDDLPPLPPSLYNSHNTAAAAARALEDDSSTHSASPMVSPRKSKRSKRDDTSSQNDNSSPSSMQALIAPHIAPKPSPFLQAQQQEEKRAALRDYRAQARPIFSLETQAKDPDYTRNSQHDSAESFPMFSASTGSSHKTQFIGQSTGSKTTSSQTSQRHNSWLSREDSTDSSAPGRSVSMRDFSVASDGPPFSMDETPGEDSNLDGSHRDEFLPSDKVQHTEIAASPDLFLFDGATSPPKLMIHTLNPILDRSSVGKRSAARAAEVALRELSDTELSCDNFIKEDFRPIDMAVYQPKLPFAWSSFPLLCQLIAYDIDGGVACAQFATHVLLHTIPYFFSPTSVQLSSVQDGAMTLAERLMSPKLANRVIESTLRKHLSFLHQLRLFTPLAELRQACADRGYLRLLSQAGPASSEPSISGNDPYRLSITCIDCGQSKLAGDELCNSCRKSQAPCPICLISARSRAPRDPPSSSLAALMCGSAWVVCHACGHGAHMSCMLSWLRRPECNGDCPSPGCVCDCGPGLLRQKRLAEQSRAYDEKKLIRGGSGASTAKKDALRASQSPAVDRTREAMRAASGERGTQSGDEVETARRRASARTNAKATGNMSSSRKSVRLVTPGEESNVPPR
jgi:WD40 repeat protein